MFIFFPHAQRYECYLCNTRFTIFRQEDASEQQYGKHKSPPARSLEEPSDTLESSEFVAFVSAWSATPHQEGKVTSGSHELHKKLESLEENYNKLKKASAEAPEASDTKVADAVTDPDTEEIEDAILHKIADLEYKTSEVQNK